ncbi:hypothetical protein DEU56DRAFT_752064 [Suillus clintonianus]|uniref:uncharacterized protein n=1 Tax=Suillus clintonianus TaxID=1904413 RepID=UPI001B85E4AD|nr:uncharacterized protein DEU56DRAFT_752064 [Suillus clintonianus]KAG2152762.1 hypothetical protein DEU56DRAFT_752064 [Suillus clintonianus]
MSAAVMAGAVTASDPNGTPCAHKESYACGLVAGYNNDWAFLFYCTEDSTILVIQDCSCPTCCTIPNPKGATLGGSACSGDGSPNVVVVVVRFASLSEKGTQPAYGPFDKDTHFVYGLQACIGVWVLRLRQARKILWKAKKRRGVLIVGPATVGGIKPRRFRIENSGSIDVHLHAARQTAPSPPSSTAPTISSGSSCKFRLVMSRWQNQTSNAIHPLHIHCSGKTFWLPRSDAERRSYSTSQEIHGQQRTRGVNKDAANELDSNGTSENQ